MACAQFYVSLIVSVIFLRVAFLKSSDYGYSTGYLPDCPGSEKTTIITKKALKHLTFTVQGRGGAMSASRRRYTIFQGHQLLKDPDVDLKRRTIIYAGGYMDSVNFLFARTILKAYTDLGYNGIAVDTNWFTTTDYPLACRYMRPVGIHIAEFLANLTKSGLNPKKLELIGLSLGAHTISYVATHYYRLTGVKVARLTGMDPAGPCFRNLGPEDRLDPSDADFVDMIATNIDGLGMAAPTGHVNFYVNGGENQPGELVWVASLNVESHIRSFTLWISALQYPKMFIGIKCDNVQQARNNECYNRVPLETNVMGLLSNKNNTGIFYLATTNRYPYFLGRKGLRREYEFWASQVDLYNKEVIVLCICVSLSSLL